jgi:hypothetical protein
MNILVLLRYSTAGFSTVDPIRRCLPDILLQDLLHLSYKHGLGRSISPQSAVGDQIGVNWERFELEQFRMGMDVEYEHGAHDPQTDVTGDDPILTGKIALAHMKEFPDYYERLERMEKEAEREWAEARRAGEGS